MENKLSFPKLINSINLKINSHQTPAFYSVLVEYLDDANAGAVSQDITVMGQLTLRIRHFGETTSSCSIKHLTSNMDNSIHLLFIAL